MTASTVLMIILTGSSTCCKTTSIKMTDARHVLKQMKNHTRAPNTLPFPLADLLYLDTAYRRDIDRISPALFADPNFDISRYVINDYNRELIKLSSRHKSLKEFLKSMDRSWAAHLRNKFGIEDLNTMDCEVLTRRNQALVRFITDTGTTVLLIKRVNDHVISEGICYITID